MKSKLIILALCLLVSSCKFFKRKNPPEPPAPEFTIDTLTIASWNLKNFGETKLGDPIRMDMIIDILTLYDIIAIQEVQDADLSLPSELVSMINARGLNYNLVVSDRVGRGTRKEQYLFLYNDNVVDLVDGTSGYGIEPGDEFAREPFYCMFRAGNFDFYLMTIHTDPDDVDVEIPALRSAYENLQSVTPTEHDIILLGDLNAKPPNSPYNSYIDMSAIAELPNIFFAIDSVTNTKGGSAYDNIIFQSDFTSEFVNSGINVFENLFGISNDDAFSVSDHLPVWARFVVGVDDD